MFYANLTISIILSKKLGNSSANKKIETILTAEQNTNKRIQRPTTNKNNRLLRAACIY